LGFSIAGFGFLIGGMRVEVVWPPPLQSENRNLAPSPSSFCRPRLLSLEVGSQADPQLAALDSAIGASVERKIA
jgi:hypothetical protein